MKYIILSILIAFSAQSAFSQKKDDKKEKDKTEKISKPKDELQQKNEKIKRKVENNTAQFHQFLNLFEEVRFPYLINEASFHPTMKKNRKVIPMKFASLIPGMYNLKKGNNNNRQFLADKLIQSNDNSAIVIYTIKYKKAQVPYEYHLVSYHLNSKTGNISIQDNIIIAKFNNKKSILTATIANGKAESVLKTLNYKKTKKKNTKVSSYDVEIVKYAFTKKGQITLIKKEKLKNPYYRKSEELTGEPE